ncbi:MAG: protein deglycase HchA, partial [Polaribacter sp.]|nr:protein deglycase HchA [Polaribacter sp.]
MKKTLIGLASILILIVITLYITTRPAKTANGTYSPSPLALKLATSST